MIVIIVHLGISYMQRSKRLLEELQKAIILLYIDLMATSEANVPKKKIKQMY